MAEKRKSEKGEVMIEGMIVMIITMMMLIWILGLGFLYYQRYLVTTVTNDAAAKIAETYNNPESDLIMGFVEEEDLASRDLYRGYQKSALNNINKEKAKKYISHMLKKTNFAGTIKEDDIKVEYKVVQDSSLRRHIEIKTTCTFHTPFGFALDYFGMDGTTTYTAAAKAECTDIIDYYSTIDFAVYQLSGSALPSSKIIKVINSLVGLFNR